MITHKSSFSKLPFKVKFSLRKKNWYLFPQGWGWKESVTRVEYDVERSRTISARYGSVYRHRNCYLTNQYQFSWLFIDIAWSITLEPLSETFKVESTYKEPDTKEKTHV